MSDLKADGAGDGSAAWRPQQLPAAGSVERWPWLQRLRRAEAVDLEPWLEAVEAGRLVPAVDLLAVLAERLDGQASARMLAWWLGQPTPDPALLAVIGRVRHSRCRELLLNALEAGDVDAATERCEALLPLLGHQRDRRDFALLQDWALAPRPLGQRRAALEGLALGLAAWPPQSLRQVLSVLVGDLDPAMAAAAVDLLARLPGGQADLGALDLGPMAPALAQRVRRRLAGGGPRASGARS